MVNVAEDMIARVARKILPEGVAIDGVRAEQQREDLIILHTGALSKEHARALAEALQQEPALNGARVIASGEAAAPDAVSRNHKQPLPGVKKIIQVISGKGGAGKTTIAAALAFAELRAGKRVALVDADIYGPSFPALFNLNAKPPVDPDSEKMLPLTYESAHGTLALMSLGFMVAPESGLAWRGPMAGKALKQLFYSVAWPETDIMIIDMPPGTGDAHLTLSSALHVDAAIAVTQPSPLSIADAARAIAFCRKADIPVQGIIENMAYLDTDTGRMHPFGTGGGEGLAEVSHAPLLHILPLLPDAETPLEVAERLAEQIPSLSSNRRTVDDLRK